VVWLLGRLLLSPLYDAVMLTLLGLVSTNVVVAVPELFNVELELKTPVVLFDDQMTVPDGTGLVEPVTETVRVTVLLAHMFVAEAEMVVVLGTAALTVFKDPVNTTIVLAMSVKRSMSDRVFCFKIISV
jgi:hypothetical protein